MTNGLLKAAKGRKRGASFALALVFVTILVLQPPLLY